MSTLASIAKEIAAAIKEHGSHAEAIHYLVTENDISIEDSNGHEHKFSKEFSQNVLYEISEDEEVYNVINRLIEESIKEKVGTI